MNEEFKESGASSFGYHGNTVTMETDSNIKDLNKGVDVGDVLLDNLYTETKDSVGVQDNNVSNDKNKQEDKFSFKSFRQSKQRQNSTQNENDKRQSLDESELNNQDILSSSVSRSEDAFLVMGGEDGLMPLGEHRTIKSQDLLTDKPEEGENQDSEEKEDRDSSKDSVSLSR